MKLFEVTALSMSPELQQYLKRLNISQSATLSPSGKLMVNGSVAIPRIDTSISFPFESVSGDFGCAWASITSLEGSPHVVGGSFRCWDTSITSLEGAPQFVGGDFNCNHTNITSLKGAPQSVGGTFDCTGTNLTSLEGAPQSIGGGFFCAGTSLTSLEHVPQSVGGDFICRNTYITSLKGIHKTHRKWKIGGALDLPQTCADIVGLALIEGISRVQIGNVSFNVGDHDPHAFQEQLLDAGFRMQARM